jgi:hypothetical protein
VSRLTILWMIRAAARFGVRAAPARPRLLANKSTDARDSLRVDVHWDDLCTVLAIAQVSDHALQDLERT